MAYQYSLVRTSAYRLIYSVNYTWDWVRHYSTANQLMSNNFSPGCQGNAIWRAVLTYDTSVLPTDLIIYDVTLTFALGGMTIISAPSPETTYFVQAYTNGAAASNYNIVNFNTNASQVMGSVALQASQIGSTIYVPLTTAGIARINKGPGGITYIGGLNEYDFNDIQPPFWARNGTYTVNLVDGASYVTMNINDLSINHGPVSGAINYATNKKRILFKRTNESGNQSGEIL